MKKLALLCAALLLLALAGCATEEVGSSPSKNLHAAPNWGGDATCAPGCAPGQGEGW